MRGPIKEVGIDEIVSGDWVDYAAHCPIHNTPERKQYGFGRYRNAPIPEAWVTVYSGCSCAACTHGASLKKLYFDSYDAASSEAHYTVQRLNAR